MAEYDFSTLSSADFEELVCDLLNAEERSKNSGIFFKTFKDGKDKGIDFRYSTEVNSNEIIGQAKHYYRSGYDLMKRLLLREEIKKIIKLKPKRYVFATSVDLSVANTEEIKGIFNPYIKSLNDVYGLKDLNRLLELHSEVLNNHYKLWYCSSKILQKLLHYEIEGRSNEFKESELKRKIRLHVPTDSLIEARTKLEENKFVIIIGEPGVGKTTTAELLLYDYIKDDFELVYIYDDIKEVETKITQNEKKQIFYFDDFLGHNSVEMAKAKGSETALVKILKRVASSENKRFILTTRTFILTSAFEGSERLRQFNLKSKASIIQLKEYTPSIKLRLLNNHIVESDLKDDLKKVLNENKIQSFIISHANFSPRSVEFITLNDTIKDFTSIFFREFIIKNFNSPDEIWRHAYEQQIDETDRLLLNTISSFAYSVQIQELEAAFNERLNYEAKFNNFRKPLNAFRNSFKKLEGGFVKEFSNFPGYYEFINPSLTDFLLNYLRGNQDELIRISESAYYLKQLTSRLFPIGKDINIQIKGKLTERLKARLIHWEVDIKEENEDLGKLTLAILLFRYIPTQQAKPIILRLLDSIADWTIIEKDHDISFFLQYFLEDLQSIDIIEKITQISERIFPPLLFVINDFEELHEIIKLSSEKYKITDYSKLLSRNALNAFNEKVTTLLNDEIEMLILDPSNHLYASDFVARKEAEVEKIKNNLAQIGIKINPDFSVFDQEAVQYTRENNYLDVKSDDEDYLSDNSEPPF